jgi:hypothetical protein
MRLHPALSCSWIMTTVFENAILDGENFDDDTLRARFLVVE